MRVRTMSSSAAIQLAMLLLLQNTSPFQLNHKML